MSNFIKALGAAGILSVALGVATANAQTTAPSQGSTTTRADQKQQLKTLEQNGYKPGAGADPQYPNDIQAAEKRSQGQTGGMGSSTMGRGASPIGTVSQPQQAGGSH